MWCVFGGGGGGSTAKISPWQRLPTARYYTIWQVPAASLCATTNTIVAADMSSSLAPSTPPPLPCRYYSCLGPRQLADVLAVAGPHVDGVKFAGGSFMVMPEDTVRELIHLAHEHKVWHTGPLSMTLTWHGTAPGFSEAESTGRHTSLKLLGQQQCFRPCMQVLLAGSAPCIAVLMCSSAVEWPTAGQFLSPRCVSTAQT